MTSTAPAQTAANTAERAAPLHIFRPGLHTAMNGQALAFSEADLRATVAVYDPALHEAPLVVGHPQHDLPAYGWVQGLRFSDGDDGTEAGLYALPAQVNPDFADMVAAGAFKKISASFYSPQHPSNPAPGAYYLRHVGFLGAQPPAVKGLRNPSFADDSDSPDCLVLELDFADPPEPSGLPPDTEAAESGTGGSPEGSLTPPPETPTVTPEEADALKAQNEQLAADLASARSALQAQADAANTAAHTAFAEALVAQARVAAADAALIAATLDHLEPAVLPGAQAQLVEFGEGEASQPMATALKAWLQSLPARVEFGEAATRERAARTAPDVGDAQFAEGSDPERLKQHQAVKAYMAEHQVDYATAARAVIQ